MGFLFGCIEQLLNAYTEKYLLVFKQVRLELHKTQMILLCEIGPFFRRIH